MMKRIPYTSKDFNWVRWTPKDIYTISRALIHAVRQDNKRIKAIPATQRTFSNTMLDNHIPESLSRHHLHIGILKNLSPDKKIRAAAQEAEDYMQQEMIEITYDPDMYRAVQEYKKQSKKDALRPHERKFLNKAIIDYKRMGFDLPATQQRRLKKLLKDAAKVQNAFDSAINEYRDQLLVTKQELDGVSETFIASLKRKQGKYVLTLDYPVISQLITSARNVSVRQRFYDMMARKGGGANVRRVQKLLALRAEIAELLQYPTYADYVLELRMAQKPKNVMNFLHDLEKKLQPLISRDKDIIARAKKDDGYSGKLSYYDIAYYIERATEKYFKLNQEMTRPYFQLSRVMKEVFAVYEKLFSIRFKKITFPKWHPDVLWYQVSSKNNQLIGYCAFDLFPRPGKYTHMACSTLIYGEERTWHRPQDGYCAPIQVIFGNFNPPTATAPSLLSHDEVVTFFHEFGHMMHGVLTDALLASQSGNDVALDFVELPSQLFENWAYDSTILKTMSSHYRTRMPLPDEIIQSIKDSRTFLQGYYVAGQLVYGLFDMTVHTKSVSQPLPTLYKNIIRRLGLVAPSPKTIFPAGFGHIGGYAVGYYSYLWALVYAYDCFSEFEKKGITNPIIGERLKKEILSVGSSRPEMESLKKFLGRAPNNTAFLKALGIAKPIKKATTRRITNKKK